MKTRNKRKTQREHEIQALEENVRQLRREKERLSHKLWRLATKPSVVVTYLLLISGAIAIVSSVFYESSILGFVGLTLTFWGALLLLLKPEKYVKSSLLSSTALPSLTTIDRIITDLNYEGKAVNLPPLPYYIKGYKAGTVFIHSKKNVILPPVEEVAGKKVFIKNPRGICLVPPGLDLVNLYEKELGKDFTGVDLEYLQNNLPTLFVEDLEIAEDLEMTVEGDTITVKIENSIYKELCSEARKLSNICYSIGCPLCSSIACAITRAIGKPIVIEENKLSMDGKTIEVHYRIIEA